MSGRRGSVALSPANPSLSPPSFDLFIESNQVVRDAVGEDVDAGRGVILSGRCPGPAEQRNGPSVVTRILPCTGPTITVEAIKRHFPHVGVEVDEHTKAVSFRQPADLDTYSDAERREWERCDLLLGRVTSFTFLSRKGAKAPDSYVAVPHGLGGQYLKMPTVHFLEQYGDRLRGTRRNKSNALCKPHPDRVTYVTLMHESAASCINDAAYMARTAEEYASLSSANNAELLPIIGETVAHDEEEAPTLDRIATPMMNTQIPTETIHKTLTVVGFGVFATRDIRGEPDAPEKVLVSYGFGGGKPEADLLPLAAAPCAASAASAAAADDSPRRRGQVRRRR